MSRIHDRDKRKMAANAAKCRNSNGFPFGATSPAPLLLGPAVDIVESNDVILAEIGAALYLD